MNRTTKHRIAKYQFQDSVQAAKTVIAANFIFATLLVMQDYIHVFSGARVYICLLSAGMTLIAHLYLKWESFKINMVIVLIYLSLFLFEYFYVGTPNNLVAMDRGLSKGIMLELMIGIIPYLYMTLRILLIIPLLLLAKNSKTYHDYEKSLD